jgi:hypothetical protein
MLAVVQLLALVLAYWAFRQITKKRLRDLPIRWSFVLLALAFGPVGYYLFGLLEREGIINEIYEGHAYNAMLGGSLAMIFLSGPLLIAALVLFLQESKRRKS